MERLKAGQAAQRCFVIVKSEVSSVENSLVYLSLLKLSVNKLRRPSRENLGVKLLEEKHERARAVVGGDGGGPQFVDISTVVHMNRPRLVRIQGDNGLKVFLVM